MKSQMIGRMGAQKIQNRAQRCGDLVIWTVYDHPIDFPSKFVARPFIGLRALPVHIEADSLELLRARLPLDLTGPMPRAASDDAKILETWI